MDTFLLIGLGNPGREYKDNRHNIGFMLVDRLAVRLDARGMKLQSKAIVTSGIHEERKVLLAKPQTYMNLSGQSVQGLLRFYKIPPENLIVAHDDLDLPLGTIRIRPGGGSGRSTGDGIHDRIPGHEGVPAAAAGYWTPARAHGGCRLRPAELLAS